MRRKLYENGLSLFFLALFAGSLVGQAFAGQDAYNNAEVDHAALLDEEPEPLSLWRYVTSSHFGQAVMENWQSEFLQFSIFVLATVWLVQKGSTESKPLHQAGPDSDPFEPTGVRDWLRANSLIVVMGTIFLGSWFAQSVTGWSAYNAEQLEHEAERASWLGYVGTAEFWEETLQNWQSEFLAVGTMAIFSVYLRQRGSSQSKPVEAPHDQTAAES